jgi:hypothetical protein
MAIRHGKMPLPPATIGGPWLGDLWRKHTVSQPSLTFPHGRREFRHPAGH